jgi:hypothetical protein
MSAQKAKSWFVPSGLWRARISLQTLGSPFAFVDEIGNVFSQYAVNLSSSNIVTVILSALTPVKDIQVNTSIYFGTLTVVNICLGIAATVLTWL